MYRTSRWATNLAHLLIPLKWNLILLSKQHFGSVSYPGSDSYPERVQLYHFPLEWGFLFLSVSSCKLMYPGIPLPLSSCFTSGNMPPFLLPCSGHLHYSPLDSSSGWQKKMVNRHSTTHLLVCFRPLMHDQHQMDGIAWAGDNRLISSSVHYNVRGVLCSKVMLQLYSLKKSAVCWPENRTDSITARGPKVCFLTRLAGGNMLWFHHHCPNETVSHSHFKVFPLHRHVQPTWSPCSETKLQSTLSFYRCRSLIM